MMLDIDTSRMIIRKSRLKRIREYISDNGVFPTNIVVSLRVSRRSVRFEKGEGKKAARRAQRYGARFISYPAYRSVVDH